MEIEGCVSQARSAHTHTVLRRGLIGQNKWKTPVWAPNECIIKVMSESALLQKNKVSPYEGRGICWMPLKYTFFSLFVHTVSQFNTAPEGKVGVWGEKQLSFNLFPVFRLGAASIYNSKSLDPNQFTHFIGWFFFFPAELHIKFTFDVWHAHLYC